jgi:thiamine-monophosphate kinase
MPPRGNEPPAAIRRLALIAVTDRRRIRGDPRVACRAALRGGATAILLRDRDLRRSERRALAIHLRKLTRDHGAALLIHTDLDLALEVEAEGLHLSAASVAADPAAVAAARSAGGPGLLVGVSTHGRAEVQAASAAAADYAFFGPLYPSRSHPGAKPPPPHRFLEISRRSPIPLVPIGGLTPARIRALGLRSAAAIDSLLGAADPERSAALMLASLASAGETVGAAGGGGGGTAAAPAPAAEDERTLVGSFLRSMGTLPLLQLGPGDDAVVLRDGTAAATDVTVEGVHYRPGTAAAAVGFKAAGRALSDLAAVGAVPTVLMVGLAVRRGHGAAARARGLQAGIAAAARAAGAAVAGGDTKEGPGTESVAITALGAVRGRPPLPRSGGRPGDALFVTGPLGGSLRGRHLRPRPRIREGLALRRGGLATACIDLSDGLAEDLRRLGAASGCGALLDAALVPIHPDARRGAGDPLLRAFTDGEDFELLFAVSPGRAEAVARRGVAGRRVHRVGRLLPSGAGFVVQGRMGILEPLPDGGWVHFRGGRP